MIAPALLGERDTDIYQQPTAMRRKLLMHRKGEGGRLGGSAFGKLEDLSSQNS